MGEEMIKKVQAALDTYKQAKQETFRAAEAVKVAEEALALAKQEKGLKVTAEGDAKRKLELAQEEYLGKES